MYSDAQNSEQTFGIHIENVADIRRDFDNHELAVRIESQVKNGDKFFTDLNGFDMQMRRFMEKLPLQGNFYPLPTQVCDD